MVFIVLICCPFVQRTSILYLWALCRGREGRHARFHPRDHCWGPCPILVCCCCPSRLSTKMFLSVHADRRVFREKFDSYSGKYGRQNKASVSIYFTFRWHLFSSWLNTTIASILTYMQCMLYIKKYIYDIVWLKLWMLLWELFMHFKILLYIS